MHETISFLACNLAKGWLVLNFYIILNSELEVNFRWKCHNTIMPSYSDLWFTVNHNTCFKLPLFSDITISQGSVATRLRCGGIFRYHFTANLSPSPTVKEFRKISRDLTKLPPWVWWSSFFGTVDQLLGFFFYHCKILQLEITIILTILATQVIYLIV